MDFLKNLDSFLDSITHKINIEVKRSKCTLILPALNEERTIYSAIRAAQKCRLIDEILVIDDGSSDNTKKVAEKAGVRVIRHEHNRGKGAAIKTGLEEAKYDVLCFADSDIPNWTPKMFSDMISPVSYGEVDLVKTSFSRSKGRVTILTARPLLKLFFPEMSFEQPLSGQFCTTKEFLSQLDIADRYGIDIAILIDAVRHGLKVKEVFIGDVINKSKKLKDLEPMADQVAETIFRKAGIIPDLYPWIFLCIDGVISSSVGKKYVVKNQKFLPETIYRLKKRQHTISIISFLKKDKVDRFVIAHNLSREVGRFFFSGASKASAEKAFFSACESQGADPLKTLVVTDSKKFIGIEDKCGLLIGLKKSDSSIKSRCKKIISSWLELLVIAQ